MPRSSSTKLEKQTAGKSSNQITLQQPRHDWPAELGVGVAKRYVVKACDRDCIASSPLPPPPHLCGHTQQQKHWWKAYRLTLSLSSARNEFNSARAASCASSKDKSDVI